MKQQQTKMTTVVVLATVLVAIVLSSSFLVANQSLLTRSATISRLARQSALIVNGIVTTSTVGVIDRQIFTFYDVIVLETIKGSQESHVTIGIRGGAVEVWPDAPHLKPGDGIVFFGNQMPFHAAFIPTDGFVGLVQSYRDPSTGKAFVAPWNQNRFEYLQTFLEEIRTVVQH